MNYVCTTLFFCCALLSDCFGQEEILKEARQIADEVEKNVGELAPGSKVLCEQDCLIVEFKVREFKVHRNTYDGWSDDVEVIRGPNVGGWRIEAMFDPGPYRGALVRGAGPDLSPDRAYREPYFYATFCLVNFAKGHAQVNISFGEAADKKVIQAVYDLIAETAKKELGVVNKDEKKAPD